MILWGPQSDTELLTAASLRPSIYDGEIVHCCADSVHHKSREWTQQLKSSGCSPSAFASGRVHASQNQLQSKGKLLDFSQRTMQQKPPFFACMPAVNKTG